MRLPRILLLYKHSTYRTYFMVDNKLASTLRRTHNSAEVSRFRRTHEVHYWTLSFIEAVLKGSHLPYVRHCRGHGVDYGQFDLIITVGGDGTFLEAAREIEGQSILGVNSDPSWSVGRFCAATHKNFMEMLDLFLKGKSEIKLLHRLKLDINGHAPVNVLNDVLICHKNPGALSRYYLKVGAINEEQRSSGIWIATAAGSSGAIYSAGGEVLPEESASIQYRPRELYRGRGTKYKLKGAVLSRRATIKVTSLTREGVIYADGSHRCLPFSFGCVAKIRHSPHPLRMVWRKNERSFIG